MSIKEMTKDDWELLSNKDITNLLLTEKGATNTATLYKTIIKLLNLPASTFDAKIGDYYTSLTTDKRFILLEDGKWDLKKRHSSDKIVIVEDDEDDELEDFKEEDELAEEEADTFDKTAEDDEEFDDDEDDLKDLVVLDEDELELEQ
ncbi:MAG: DNA-directed RNA polymerase subunit delta [Bacilli bacterium]